MCFGTQTIVNFQLKKKTTLSNNGLFQQLVNQCLTLEESFKLQCFDVENSFVNINK